MKWPGAASADGNNGSSDLEGAAAERVATRLVARRVRQRHPEPDNESHPEPPVETAMPCEVFTAAPLQANALPLHSSVIPDRGAAAAVGASQESSELPKPIETRKIARRRRVEEE